MVDSFSPIKECREGMLVPIKVVPNASQNKIVGWENGVLKIRINAVAEKGKANQAVISFLAKTWKIPKSSLSIYSGETHRNKILLIRDLPKKELPFLTYTQVT